MDGRKRSIRMRRLTVRLVMIVATVSALELPAEEHAHGAALIRSLWRSDYLGATVSPERSGPTDSLGMLFLPHIPAATTEPTLHASGGARTDGNGGGGALGGTYPGLRAAWSGATGVYRDEDGLLWRGDAGAARPIGRRTTAGASVTTQFADGDDGSDIGVGINLGGSIRIGGYRALSGVTLHGGIRNIGKTARRFDDEVPIFPAFTPVAGVQFSPLRSEAFSFDVTGTVSFDRFSGVSVDGAGVFQFGSGVVATVGWWHRFGSEDTGVWPGVSVAVGIPVGGTAPRARAHLSGQPARDGTAVIAGGVRTHLRRHDATPPRLEVAPQEPPGEGAGAAGGDTVLLGGTQERHLLADLLAEDDGGIAVSGAELRGPAGTVVREWEFSPRGAVVPEGDLTERLTAPLRITRFDGQILWNVDQSEGDGFYRLDAFAVDQSGNRTEIRALDILVDTTPPEISVDDEGIQEGREPGQEPDRREYVLRTDETYELTFSVRDAESIQAFVVDEAGRSMFPVSPEISSDADESGFLQAVIRWNGADVDGIRLERGAYRIRIDASDLFGNTAHAESSLILVEREEPEFQLGISDDRVAPNGDGYRDTVVVRPELSPLSGLREWRIAVVEDATGETTAQWSGIDLPPEEIVLGELEFPRDGEYSITGVSRYDNGVETTALSRGLTVDRVAPEVSFALSRQTVRPEQGREVVLFFEGDGTVARSRIMVTPVVAANTVDAETIAETPGLPDRMSWFMTDGEDRLLPPGIYRIEVEVEDETGNRSRSDSRDIVLQERLSGAEIVPTVPRFSPDGNGVLDTVDYILDGPDDVTGTFSFTLSDADGDPTRTVRGSLPLPERITWDGQNDDGVPVADGVYRPELTLEIPGVDAMSVVGPTVAVDTEAPQGEITIVGDRVISPDGDGVQDALEIRTTIRAGDPQELSVLLRRVGSDGDRSIVEIDPPEIGVGEYSWVPRISRNATLPDGEYEVGLRLGDEAGNTRSVWSEPFQIDTRPVRGFLRVDASRINPEGEADIAAVGITPVLTDPDGLVSWRLHVEAQQSGEVVFSATGDDRTLPQAVRWPAAGASVADGEYRAVFRARYAHGPVIEEESGPVLVDTQGPVLEVSRTPELFSPDGDGQHDITTFSVTVSDRSDIRYWYLEILDPRGAFFYDAGAEGTPPRRIRWDGRARNGEQVLSAETYQWRLEVSDVLGNTTIRSGDLPVDVLVEPYQGGYRIQVPSITFPPNSAELRLNGENEVAVQNRRVIERIVEILNRFPEYSILVEGHAVNISGTAREQEEELIPLSRRRAQAVRDALIERGVPSTIVGAEGRGGAVPIVDHTNEEMRWKNRRVDFILQR